MWFKNILMQKLALLLLFISFTISCKKKDKLNTLIEAASFTWNYKGIKHTGINPYAENESGIIVRIHGDEDNFNTLMLFTRSTAPGVYYADASDTVNGAVLTYTKSIDTIMFVMTPAGKIDITSNANNKLSGSFDLITEEGEALTGSFQHVPLL